jgi:hypothetical protein
MTGPGPAALETASQPFAQRHAGTKQPALRHHNRYSECFRCLFKAEFFDVAKKENDSIVGPQTFQRLFHNPLDLGVRVLLLGAQSLWIIRLRRTDLLETGVDQTPDFGQNSRLGLSP